MVRCTLTYNEERNIPILFDSILKAQWVLIDLYVVEECRKQGVDTELMKEVKTTFVTRQKVLYL